ncbi:MAG TPA: trehalose-phosphatase [Gemmataceae bacterium]|nr:trehalose-phosphatase [Gemmataceae bacterium]
MARALFDDLENIRARLARASNLFIVLDFDGTLTRILEKPGNVWLDTDTRRLVTDLSRQPHVKVVVASGRGLDDLRLRVGIPNLIYIGNHGLEMNGPCFTFDRIAPLTTEQDLCRIAASLRDQLAGVPGVELENKRLSIGVHHRMTPTEMVDRVREVIARCLSGWPGFRVLDGLKVFDIQPNIDWNKGTASAWLRRVLGLESALSICIGDDRTDEDMFRALVEGITIKVGADEASAAHYCVPDSGAVRRFLQWLLECPLSSAAAPM